MSPDAGRSQFFSLEGRGTFSSNYAIPFTHHTSIDEVLHSTCVVPLHHMSSVSALIDADTVSNQAAPRLDMVSLQLRTKSKSDFIRHTNPLSKPF